MIIQQTVKALIKEYDRNALLSPTLFNIHMNETIIHVNQIYLNGNEINDDRVLNTLLFAGGQVILLRLKI